jgi:hypothetical protein
MKKNNVIEAETHSDITEFTNSEIYKNWWKYNEKYKKILSEDDILDIKKQIGSISHEIESAYSHDGKFGPLFIIEKLYSIQKRIAKNNETILLEL